MNHGNSHKEIKFRPSSNNCMLEIGEKKKNWFRGQQFDHIFPRRMSPEYQFFLQKTGKTIKMGIPSIVPKTLGHSTRSKWVANLLPGRASASLQLLQERCQDVWGQQESILPCWFLCQIGCQVTLQPGTCHFQMFVNNTASLATRLAIQDSRNADSDSDTVIFLDVAVYKHSHKMLPASRYLTCVFTVSGAIYVWGGHARATWKKCDFDSSTAFSETQLVCSGTTVLHLSIAAWATKLRERERERERFGKGDFKPDIFGPSLASNGCCHFAWLSSSQVAPFAPLHRFRLSAYSELLRYVPPGHALEEQAFAAFRNYSCRVRRTVCDGRWTVICSSLHSLGFWFLFYCWPCEFWCEPSQLRVESRMVSFFHSFNAWPLPWCTAWSASVDISRNWLAFGIFWNNGIILFRHRRKQEVFVGWNRCQGSVLPLH